MWARVVELMLGLWLVCSPFIFAIPSRNATAWGIDLGIGAAVVMLSLMCFWRPLRRAHLLTLVFGAGLAVAAWLQPRPLAPEQQNHLLIGLMLAIVAIVPSDTLRPPEPWRRWRNERN